MSSRYKLSQQYFKEINTRRQPHLPYSQDFALWSHLEGLFFAHGNNPNLTKVQLQDINENNFITSEREQIVIIHEIKNKQNAMYNYNSASSTEYQTQTFNQQLIEVLNNNSSILLNQTQHNHCIVFLYETNSAFHLLLIVSQKNLQIDNIQFRSDCVTIQAWSNLQLQIIFAQVIWDDNTYNELYTNTLVYNNNNITAYEIKISNQQFQQPLPYINDQEKLPLLQIVIQQDEKKRVVLTTFLNPQQSILSNRIGCKTQDFLKYIFSNWNKKMCLERSPSVNTPGFEKQYDFQSFMQQSHNKNDNNEKPIFQNHLQLTPIQETFAENFISSIKGKTKNKNQDDDLAGVLSKYGLEEEFYSGQNAQLDMQVSSNNLAGILSKYGLEGDNSSNQLPQYEFKNPQQSNTVQSVFFFKTESSVDQINSSINQVKNQPQSFQIDNNLNQQIDYSSRIQSDGNINSKYEGFSSQNQNPNQKQQFYSQIQSLPLYQTSKSTSNLNFNQSQEKDLNLINQQNIGNQELPLEARLKFISQKYQIQPQTLCQNQTPIQQPLVSDNQLTYINNPQPILEQNPLQIEQQPQQYYRENQNILIQQPQLNYDTYYQQQFQQQQLIQWQNQHIYQQQIQQIMNTQYNQYLQQQLAFQQQSDQNYIEKKKSSSILSPYSSLSSKKQSDSNLLCMSEKIEKRSVSEDVYYSSRKNSVKSYASSSQRPKKSDNKPEFKSSLVRRLSIRQIKLQSQNKLVNSIPNKPKLSDFGIEVLTNLSDNQPIIKLDEISPQDFTDFSSHHSIKKQNQILKLFQKGNKVWKSIQRPFSQLYNDVKFADLTLSINDQNFKVHKSVMISFSPYFQKLLSNSRTSSTIELQEIDQYTLPIVLKYIYLQQISQSQLEEITLEMGQKILKTSQKFEISNLCEEIVARIIIPKMRKESCLEWFQLVCQNLQYENSLSYIYRFLYKYLLRFFATNSNYIIILIRKHQQEIREIKVDQKLSDQLQEARNYFQIIQKINSNSFTDLVINALQNVQPDAVENLLWILMVRLNLKDYISLIQTFSQQYFFYQRQFFFFRYEDVRSGFQYRNFKKELCENQVQLVKLECFSIIKSIKSKTRKRNSIFIPQNKKNTEIVDEEILNQYQFKQEKPYSDAEAKIEQIKFQPCDYEFLIDITKMTSKKNIFLISQCFSSGTNCWRIILDLDEDRNTSLYLQERGSIKNNAQNLTFQGDDDTFVPEGTNQEYISIIFRVEISTDNKQIIVSRSLFHSFPIKQLYSIGFQNIFNLNQIQKFFRLKIWIIESSVHSCAMTYMSKNFGQILNTKPESILRISNYDLYSLLSSDQLNILEEDSVKKLFYILKEENDKKQNQSWELLIYPIRFTYLTHQVVLSLCRDIKYLREDKLFQKYVSLLFHWNIEAENINPLQPRKHYATLKSELSLSLNFYDSLLAWLFTSDHQQQMKLNVDQMKNEIEKQKNSFGNLQKDIQQIKITPVKQVPPHLQKSKAKIQQNYVPQTNKQQEKPPQNMNNCTLL